MTQDAVLQEGWLTTSEVAERTGYTGAYIRQLILSGEIREGTEAVKRGGIWFVAPQVVSRLRQRRKSEDDS